MATIKTTIHINEATKSTLLLGKAGVESLSERLLFLATSARKVAEEACPELPLGVWLALINANNGTAHSYATGANAVVTGMLHNLADSCAFETQRFGVENPHALAVELMARPWEEKFAIFEVVRGFWAAEPSPEHKTVEARLKASGARIRVQE